MNKIQAIDIVNLIKTYPDNRINPTDDEGGCIYTDLDGNHCIAGQMLADFGFDVPDSRTPFGGRWRDRNLNSESIREVVSLMKIDHYFTPDALELMFEAQFYADRETHLQGYDISSAEEYPLSDDAYNAWGVAKTFVFQKYESFLDSEEKV